MSPDHTRKSADKIAASGTGANNLLNDAPLFAGLEGFVLSQPLKAVAENRSTEKPTTPKTTTVRQKKPAKTPAPQPVRAPKTQRSSAIDGGSVLLTVNEMCTLLNISRATLVRMDNTGKLPGRIRLGGSVRFHRTTVENWLQSLISTHPTP